MSLVLPLARHARGFCDRTMTRLEVSLERLWVQSPAYRPVNLEVLMHGLEVCLGVGVGDALAEPALAHIEQAVRDGLHKLAPRAPFPLVHNADPGLARLCYVMCRAIRPDVFVETGVAYGVTSAFVLKAMEVNGHGSLHSVDRPPLGYQADQFVGALIPETLRPRWRLYRDISKRVLPGLLAELKQVDVFLHDSRHTYRNIRWELETVTPYLARRSVVMADDVDRNAAFQEWVARNRPPFSATLREADKQRLLGMGVFVDRVPPRS